MKKILTVLLAVLLLFTLCACGRNTPELTFSGIIRPGNITKTYDFHNSYAWVRGEELGTSFYALIDNTGKTLFTDYYGLADETGKTYKIHSYFHAVDCSYPVDTDLQELPVAFADDYASWQFNEGYALVLCKSEGLSYFCVVDPAGAVKQAVELPAEGNYMKLEDIRQLQAYYNGKGTYFIQVPGGDPVCLNADLGQLQADIPHDRCFPARFGHFAFCSEDSGKTTYRLLDANGMELSSKTEKTNAAGADRRFYLEDTPYRFFLSEDLASDLAFENIYNLETNTAFSVSEKIGTVASAGADLVFNTFSSENDKVCFYEITYETLEEKNDRGQTVKTKSPPIFTIYSIDENGNTATVCEHRTAEKYDIGKGSYLLAANDSGALFYFDDGVYYIDFDSGEKTRVFAAYADKLSSLPEYYVLNRDMVGTLLYNDDGEACCAISTLSGSILLAAEKSRDFSKEPLRPAGADKGLFFHPFEQSYYLFFTADGTSVQMNKNYVEDGAVFTNGFLNTSSNYISEDGQILIR